MRRKSPRTAAPKASPEKTKSPPTTKKTRRYTRRKKQSTSESSDDSQDGQSLQEIAKQAVKPAPADDENAEPVWKVTPSNTQTGEIQKLKICLTRPSPSTPERTTRRRNKSRGDTPNEESSTQEDEKNSEVEDREEKKGKGKSKGKHKSKIEKQPQTNEQEVEMPNEISENVQVTPLSPPIDIPDAIPMEAKPHIAEKCVKDQETVDNEGNTGIVSQTIETVTTEDTNIISQISETNENAGKPETTDENQRDATQTNENREEDASKQQTSPCVETNESQEGNENKQKADLQINEKQEEEVKESPEINDKQEEKKEKSDLEVITQANKSKEEEVQKIDLQGSSEANKNQEEEEQKSDLHASTQTKASEEEEGERESDLRAFSQINQNQDIENRKCELQVTETKVETNADLETKSEQLQVEVCEEKEEIEATKQAASETKEDSQTVNENEEECSVKESVEKIEESTTIEVKDELKPSQESPESMPSQIENTTNESFVEYMEVDVSENEHFRNLSEEIIEEQQKSTTTVIKEKKKRKWGKRDYSLQAYIANIFKIDFESLKKICEEIQFLNEDEIKLDTAPPEERRKSVEQKQRKVSVDETVKPELKTQSSVNSEESNFETSANIIAMNRKISIVDDTASKLKPPPSPAKNPVSDVLYITNLVRPFTLKQLKELLGRTGQIIDDGFWTDHIKSKCYVQYETSEEAEATRNALHGVQWPIGNGKKLIIEYSTREELEKAKNPPPPAPIVTETKLEEKEAEVAAVKEPSKEENIRKSEDRREKRKKEMREWDIGKEDLERDRRSRSRDRTERKRHARHSASPVDDFITRKQRKQEDAPPQKLMDDLFQKTKATPCIYWLPLTPEEIAMKQQQRLIRMEEHKRRLEEAVRNRAGPYRRRYD